MPGTSGYDVFIANDSHFTIILREYVTAYTTLTPGESLPDSQAGEAYFWFVRPCVGANGTDCGPGPDNVNASQNAARFTTGMYSTSGLPNRVHTIRIQAVGTRTGAGSSINVDCINPA